MDYVLIKGVVRSLKIRAGQEDLNIFPKVKDATAVAGIVEVMMENTSSATLLSGSRNDSTIQMEYFDCFVDEKGLTGKFYKVGFFDGDEIEFVAENIGDTYRIHAACSESKRLIWTLPYQTRGYVAQRNGDVFGSFICAIIAAISFFLIVCIALDRPGAATWKLTYGAFIISFTSVLIVNALVRWQFHKFSREATKIFRVLGFLNPEYLDLPKDHKSADIQYRHETSEKKISHPAWQFRFYASKKSVKSSAMLSEKVEFPVRF